MHGPDGRNYDNEWQYVEIVRPERIVMEHRSAPRFRMTATFAEEGTGTRVTMRSTFESAQLLRQVIEAVKADKGLQENIDRLGDYLRGMS
jgi:uncharacterized protein YndB with AHSA1/START domain